MKSRIRVILATTFIFLFGAWSGASLQYYIHQSEVALAPARLIYPQTDTPDDPIGSPMDIMDIPADILRRPDLNSIHLIQNSSRDTIFKDSMGRHHAVTYQDSPIGWIQFSHGWDYRLGFFHQPQFFSQGSTSDTALAILNAKTREIKEVYRGSYKTSSWEWDGASSVIVYYNCGSSCRYAYKIYVKTGEVIEEYQVPTS